MKAFYVFCILNLLSINAIEMEETVYVPNSSHYRAAKSLRNAGKQELNDF